MRLSRDASALAAAERCLVALTRVADSSLLSLAIGTLLAVAFAGFTSDLAGRALVFFSAICASRTLYLAEKNSAADSASCLACHNSICFRWSVLHCTNR